MMMTFFFKLTIFSICFICLGQSFKFSIQNNRKFCKTFVNFRQMTIFHSKNLHLSKSNEPISLKESLDRLLNTFNPIRWNISSFRKWEDEFEIFGNKITNMPTTDPNYLLVLYEAFLKSIINIKLDPLQIHSFEEICSKIIVKLLDKINENKEDNLDELFKFLDDITDLHLRTIEKLAPLISTMPINDSETEEENTKIVCYQFALLITKCYKIINFQISLRPELTMKNSQQKVPDIETWTLPIFARLQRRYPAFQSSFVQDKLDGMIGSSLSILFERIEYNLEKPFSFSSSIHDNNQLSEWPGWTLANFVLKVFRRIIDQSNYKRIKSAFTVYALEKYSEMLQTPLLNIQREFVADNELDYLRRGSRLLENVGKDINSNDQSIPKAKLNLDQDFLTILSDDQIKGNVEQIINVGQQLLAANIIHWHLDHVLVRPFSNDPEQDFKRLLPLDLFFFDQSGLSSINKASGLSSLPPKDSINYFIPNEYIDSTQEYLQNLNKIRQFTYVNSSFLDYSDKLLSLTPSLKKAMNSNYRALSLYNLDLDIHPLSRDDVYSQTISLILSHLLIQPKSCDQDIIEIALVMKVLHEIIGTRNPDEMALHAYQQSITNSILTFFQMKQNPVDRMYLPDGLIHRYKLIDYTFFRFLFTDSSSIVSISNFFDKTKQNLFTSILKRFISQIESIKQTSDSSNSHPSTNVRQILSLLRNIHNESSWFSQILSLPPKYIQDQIDLLIFTQFDAYIQSLCLSMPPSYFAKNKLEKFDEILSIIKTFQQYFGQTLDFWYFRVHFQIIALNKSYLSVLLESKTEDMDVNKLIENWFELSQHPFVQYFEQNIYNSTEIDSSSFHSTWSISLIKDSFPLSELYTLTEIFDEILLQYGLGKNIEPKENTHNELNQKVSVWDSKSISPKSKKAKRIKPVDEKNIIEFMKQIQILLYNIISQKEAK